MKQAVSSSRTADKFVVRLPDGMRGQIANKARMHLTIGSSRKSISPLPEGSGFYVSF